MTTTIPPSTAAIWKILEQVNDPEVPVLSVIDLGIIRNVEVENDEVIPIVIRHLVEQDASILSVNPRGYTLEDIYFALQAGES